MTGDVVIRAEGLGKKYVIGHQSAERVPTLRDAISRGASSLARTTRDLLHGKPLIAGDEIEEFWALKDVNFEIRRGDVVGIIGRNGAGKSTLLKVLSRITEPSEGRVEIRGRVASLLEVGTGFHPELTGRENIFLNGAILGMGRSEIRRKFDEIVAFAEIEQFLDTPVKRYSSGMYVRLAFAVAAHLEPEILIVDEVLAVGDAEFQEKCLGKMQDVAGEGRTVLFVSHNLAAISGLCLSALYLSNGSLAGQSTVDSAINLYLQRTPEPKRNKFVRIAQLAFDASASILELEVRLREDELGSIQKFSLFLTNSFNVRVGLVDLVRIKRVGPNSDTSMSIKIKLPDLVPGSYQVSFYIESVVFSGDITDVGGFNISSSTAMPFEAQYMGVTILDAVDA